MALEELKAIELKHSVLKVYDILFSVTSANKKLADELMANV